MPETVKKGVKPMVRAFPESGMYGQLLSLGQSIGQVYRDPVENLQGSIRISKREWIEEVVSMENWLE